MAEKLSRPMSDTEAGLDEFDKWYNDHREIAGSLTRTYIACRAAWRAAPKSEIKLDSPKHRWTGSEGADAELLEKAYDYGGFESAVLECNLAGPEAFATDENGRYRYDQMRSLEQFWRAASGITQDPATLRETPVKFQHNRFEHNVDRMAQTIINEHPGSSLSAAYRAVAQELFNAAHSQREQDVIPGIAGQSPCAGCGKGMDGAFDSVSRVGGKWYHQNCISQREQAPAQEQPKCDCGAGDDAYLACHAEKCSLRKWANPASEARSQAAPQDSTNTKEVMPHADARRTDHRSNQTIRAVTGDSPSGERANERRSQAAREIAHEVKCTHGNIEKRVLAILDRWLSGEQ